MKLHFLGANHQVTGSRYCIETTRTRVMVDCGLFQEREFIARNWHADLFPPNSVDAMVLTHAHIDHTGLVPKMVKDGFAGPIYCTSPTADLVDIMLRDSADIQEEDAAYKKKRHKKEGRMSRYPIEPLYETRHVEQLLPLLRGVAYRTPTRLTDDISVTFHDAGHILGSAMLEFDVVEDGVHRTLVFSGDIGQSGKPLIHDPSQLTKADFLVMESTYGNREHAEGGDVESQFADIINSTVEARGKIVIPTFAVERAQEVVYYLARLVDGGQIPRIAVYLDSPMAVDVTKVFRDHRDCLDDDAQELMSKGNAPLHFPGLIFSRSSSDSQKINDVEGPCIIMSTSGMCTAGRIKHHLRRTISDHRNTILFVGYQANGTLGRQILDGKPEVRIHGREYQVRASIRQIYGFSGHADRNGLLRWARAFARPPRKVFLSHGDEDAAFALAKLLCDELGWAPEIPQYQSLYDLD